MPTDRADAPSAPAAARPSLQGALTAFRNRPDARILLRGGVYQLDAPVVIAGDQTGIEISACAGEHPRLQAAAGMDRPMVTLQAVRDVRISHLEFAGHLAAAIEMVGAECNALLDNRFTDVGIAVLLRHAGANRIVGNHIAGAHDSGIEAKEGSDHNLIADNDIADIQGPETHGGGIFLHGANGNRISHNQVAHTEGMGIGIANWDDTTLNIGNVVEYNRVTDTNRGATDSGAIYLLGRSQADMQTVVAGNVVEATGSASEHSVGIYLDDSASGVTVVRNLVREPGSDAVQIHGGSANTIANNILDLGAGRPSAVLFQAAPDDTHPSNLQEGNEVARNLILARHATPKVFVWLDGGTPRVSRNIYGGTAFAALPGPGAGPVRDDDPVHLDAAPEASAERDYWLGQRLAAAEGGFVPFAPDQAGPRPPIAREAALPGCLPPRP